MPAREAYLVKKIHWQSVPSGQTLFPAVLKTVCSKLTFWWESPASPEVRGPTRGRGARNGGRGDIFDQEMNGISRPGPQMASEAECSIPTWPKKRNILGFGQWVSRTGRGDLVSFGCEMVTCQWAGGALKVTPREAVTTAKCNGPVMTPGLSALCPIPGLSFSKPAHPTIVVKSVSSKIPVPLEP